MPKEIQKVFVKVVTLDWHDYRCLEQGIMTYIILGLERAFIMDFYLPGDLHVISFEMQYT